MKLKIIDEYGVKDSWVKDYTNGDPYKVHGSWDRDYYRLNWD